MDIQAMQAAARAKLQQTDTYIDPTQETPIPIIVQRVVPKVEAPKLAAHVLEANQSSFAILTSGGQRLMFSNYRFQTDDANLAEQIIREYAPKIWRA